MHSTVRGVASTLIVLMTACGGVTERIAPQDAGPAADTAPPDLPDTSVPDADTGPNPVYPAPHTPMPLVNNNGGRVIHNPKIVSITWSGDSSGLVSRLQQFDDLITTTPYWTTTTSEYCEANGGPCIGSGTAGEHVVITDAPPSGGFTDSAMGGASTMQTWIQTEVTSNVSMPDPTPDTIYAIYLPPNVDITLDGTTSCNGFGAYHNATFINPKSGSAVLVAYAIMPRCGSKESTTTVSASHEFAEAATDPDIGSSLTFYMQNQTWTAFGGGEVGDLCEFGFGMQSATEWTESTFTVQRTWSNKSAKASHNPCVPIPSGEVYFNAAPRKQVVNLKNIGDTAVLDLDAYSDAPIADWTVTAFDAAQFMGGSSHLSFAFDKTTANNGSHLQLTVTLTAALSPSTIFGIVSQGGNSQTYTWPVLALQ